MLEAMDFKLGLKTVNSLESIVVLVDARCLQEERFRDRGIGKHLIALLEGAAQFFRARCKIILIAAVDRRLPSLTPECLKLFMQEVSISNRDLIPDIFLNPCPMTYSPDPFRWLLEKPSVLTCAIVYDFIPLEHPEAYLRNEGEQNAYLKCLANLGEMSCFISISNHTKARLREVFGIVEDSFVSGVAIRNSIISPMSSSSSTCDNYIVVVGGNDPRKNVELPIRAHAVSRQLQDAKVQLMIVGSATESWLSEVKKLYMSLGGDIKLLSCLGSISDAELAALYGGALLCVSPSRSEGFSIPVVEANANGCLVFVSNCPAQIELVPDSKFHFQPDDTEGLRYLMESALDPKSYLEKLRSQGEFWKQFTEEAVCERFWGAIWGLRHDRVDSKKTPEAFSLVKKSKPQIAIVSPVPPDFSGVAEFTLATMTALSKKANLDLFTPTERPRTRFVFRSVEELTPEPYLWREHNAIISVIGNSHYHSEIFNFLIEFGGAAIAHDARMIHFYVSLLGRDRSIAIASRELKRDVSWEEIETWISNQSIMPTMFLSEILESSEKTFVHSPITQKLIQDVYSAPTNLLPFAIYRSILPEFSSISSREIARRHIGVDDEVKLLVTMGDVVSDKGIEECIWTVYFLVERRLNVRLAIIGKIAPEYLSYLERLALDIGVAKYIHFSKSPVNEFVYQSYIAAADAGMQFRTYKFGGLSGALLDLIHFGIPTVANEHLAKAMEAPSYVVPVSNSLSPLLVAERLMELFELNDRKRYQDERRVFIHRHSTDMYAQKLLESFGLE